ncbi:MAG: substrate-binding domain-containing protein [Rhodospirillales bacterium]|nr:substrate-binding domain-containing protein [Rhodospirillales bacterium]
MKRLQQGLLVVMFMAAWAIFTQQVQAAGKPITIAATTSTQNSGLFDLILPAFTKKTGITTRVIAVGTGQAIRLAMRGDADVLFVHHKTSELKFVKDGFGVERFDVMYNDFVIVGPGKDPAGIRGQGDISKALAMIAKAKTPFASRGDDSGTHKKELSLWKAAGVDPKGASGTWYREAGAGMGATMNTAIAMNAYVLSDRATWLKFKNKGAFDLLVEGDKRLFNQYGIILVNPKRHPHVKAKAGQAFIDWVIGAEGQALIASYRIKGRQAFFPNAK